MNKKNRTCEECGKSFTWPHHLNKHKAAVHDKIKFVCSYCGYKTSWKSVLRKHEAEKHDVHVVLPKERHQCVKCRNSFTIGGAFNTHYKFCKGDVESKNSKEKNDKLGVFEAEMQADDQKDLQGKIKLESSEIAIENVFSVEKTQENVIDLTDDDEVKVKKEPNDEAKSLISGKLFLCPNCDAKGRSEQVIREHLNDYHKFSYQVQKEKSLKIESV